MLLFPVSATHTNVALVASPVGLLNLAFVPVESTSPLTPGFAVEPETKLTVPVALLEGVLLIAWFPVSAIKIGDPLANARRVGALKRAELPLPATFPLEVEEPERVVVIDPVAFRMAPPDVNSTSPFRTLGQVTTPAGELRVAWSHQESLFPTAPVPTYVTVLQLQEG